LLQMVVEADSKARCVWMLCDLGGLILTAVDGFKLPNFKLDREHSMKLEGVAVWLPVKTTTHFVALLVKCNTTCGPW